MGQLGVIGNIPCFDELTHGFALDIGESFSRYRTWLAAKNVPEKEIKRGCTALIESINNELQENEVTYRMPDFARKKSDRNILRALVAALKNLSDAHAIYFIIGNSVHSRNVLEGLKEIDLMFPKAGVDASALYYQIQPDMGSAKRPTGKALTTAVKMRLQTLQGQRTILFIAADPSGSARSQSDKEFKVLQEVIERSQLSAVFRVVPEFSCKPEDLYRRILEHKPHVLHFAGHGTSQGLCFEDNSRNPVLVKPHQLDSLLADATNEGLALVFLNACYTKNQGNQIAMRVGHVVAMDGLVGTDLALDFSKAFYTAYTTGRTIAESFNSGNNGLRVSGTTSVKPSLVLGNREQPVDVSEQVAEVVPDLNVSKLAGVYAVNDTDPSEDTVHPTSGVKALPSTGTHSGQASDGKPGKVAHAVLTLNAIGGRKAPADRTPSGIKQAQYPTLSGAGRNDPRAYESTPMRERDEAQDLGARSSSRIPLSTYSPAELELLRIRPEFQSFRNAFVDHRDKLNVILMNLRQECPVFIQEMERYPRELILVLAITNNVNEVQNGLQELARSGSLQTIRTAAPSGFQQGSINASSMTRQMDSTSRSLPQPPRMPQMPQMPQMPPMPQMQMPPRTLQRNQQFAPRRSLIDEHHDRIARMMAEHDRMINNAFANAPPWHSSF